MPYGSTLLNGRKKNESPAGTEKEKAGKEPSSTLSRLFLGSTTAALVTAVRNLPSHRLPTSSTGIPAGLQMEAPAAI